MRQYFDGFSTRALQIAAACLCGILAAGVIALYTPNTAYAATSVEKQAEAQAALTSLNNMLETANQAAADYAAAQAKVQEAQATIDEQTAKIETYQKQLSTRARSMYRSGSSSFIDVLMGSATFEDFSNNWDLLNSLNSQDAELVANTKDARDQIEASKKVLAEQEQAAEKAQQEAQESAKQMQATYDSLSAEAAELLAQEQATSTASQQTVSQDQVVSFDSSTGYATLANGQTARVVGYDSNTGNIIVDTVMRYVGGNYNYGSEDAANSTFDCSGLVQYAYSQAGISVTHNSESLYSGGTVVTDPQPGDICYEEGHVGIYVGNGMMVDAQNEEAGITYRAVKSGMQFVRY